MATVATIPLSEYLTTSYEPDCDFVDGILEPRSVPEKPHSIVQGIFYSVFDRNLASWRLLPLLEQRVQTTARNFRVPDLCLIYPGQGDDNILRRPPFLCVEILSPEDTLARTTARAQEYRAMGIAHVWVIDPTARKAYRVSEVGLEPIEDTLAIVGTPVAFNLNSVFADLDLRLSF